MPKSPPHLNNQQREFARQFVAGAPGIRGNVRAAYRAAGYHARNDMVASAAASRLLAKPTMKTYIHELYAQADAEVINQIRDWKELAPQAQNRLVALTMGFLPDIGTPEQGTEKPAALRKMRTAGDAAIGRTISETARYIIDRAYPPEFDKKQPATELRRQICRMLGITLEQLPDFAPPQEPEQYNGPSTLN